MPGLAHYMKQYDHEHSSEWNKLLHGLGIPMIFLGIILLIFMKWIWGASFFVGGWVFLLLGHKIEGNHPAFFQGPIYLLVGPIWVAKEAWEFLAGTHRSSSSEGASEVTPRETWRLKRSTSVGMSRCILTEGVVLILDLARVLWLLRPL